MYEVQQSVVTHLWHVIREQAISLASKGVAMGMGLAKESQTEGAPRSGSDYFKRRFRLILLPRAVFVTRR